MIDTCDPQIATWSPHDNGETFIVTNVKAFESTIIPQFFKHSKFSSFVRQLNFYGFRKIRYAGESLYVLFVVSVGCKIYWSAVG
jgi:heat shock transcription factor 2